MVCTTLALVGMMQIESDDWTVALGSELELLHCIPSTSLETLWRWGIMMHDNSIG